MLDGELLVFIMDVPGRHWYLVIVNMRSHQIELYDTLRKDDGTWPFEVQPRQTLRTCMKPIQSVMHKSFRPDSACNCVAIISAWLGHAAFVLAGQGLSTSGLRHVRISKTLTSSGMRWP